MELFDFTLDVTISNQLSPKTIVEMDILDPRFCYHLNNTSTLLIYGGVGKGYGLYNFSQRSITEESHKVTSKHLENCIKVGVRNIQELSESSYGNRTKFISANFTDYCNYEGLCKKRKGHIKLSINQTKVIYAESTNHNTLKQRLKRETFKKYKFI